MLNSNFSSKEQELFTAYLIDFFGSEDFENKIKSVGQKDLQELYKNFKNMNEQVIYAKKGSVLDYIKYLNGQCPEGYEIDKLAKGGCMKCKKKTSKGTIEIFKDACGGKVKKRIRKKK